MATGTRSLRALHALLVLLALQSHQQACGYRINMDAGLLESEGAIEDPAEYYLRRQERDVETGNNSTAITTSEAPSATLNSPRTQSAITTGATPSDSGSGNTSDTVRATTETPSSGSASRRTQSNNTLSPTSTVSPTVDSSTPTNAAAASTSSRSVGDGNSTGTTLGPTSSSGSTTVLSVTPSVEATELSTPKMSTSYQSSSPVGDDDTATLPTVDDTGSVTPSVEATEVSTRILSTSYQSSSPVDDDDNASLPTIDDRGRVTPSVEATKLSTHKLSTSYQSSSPVDDDGTPTLPAVDDVESGDSTSPTTVSQTPSTRRVSASTPSAKIATTTKLSTTQKTDYTSDRTPSTDTKTGDDRGLDDTEEPPKESDGLPRYVVAVIAIIALIAVVFIIVFLFWLWRRESGQWKTLSTSKENAALTGWTETRFIADGTPAEKHVNGADTSGKTDGDEFEEVVLDSDPLVEAGNPSSTFGHDSKETVPLENGDVSQEAADVSKDPVTSDTTTETAATTTTPTDTDANGKTQTEVKAKAGEQQTQNGTQDGEDPGQVRQETEDNVADVTQNDIQVKDMEAPATDPNETVKVEETET